VPGYEILGELGRGGMGVVYKARQLCLNRVVALKMILAGSHAGPGATARFLREAETVARLKHPNVVQVHEFGTHEGKPYFSLEYLEGGSLADHLKGEPQPPAQAAQMVQTLARAVQTAHEQGIVHRDLKPANVLLATDGTLKITDFGLAKQGDSGMTATGEVLGTPSYMAPEQAEGTPKLVGAASDVYALGAILYELLTGRPPFKGASAWDTIQLVVGTEPVPPSRLQPKMPRDLETVCLKCLEKEPARRYATAADLAEDLRRFQAGEPIQARPPTLVSLARSLTRHYGRAAAWVFTVGFIAGLLAGLHTYATDIQSPLTWNAGAYEALPSSSRPWLAALGVIPGWCQGVLGLCMFLWLASFGLLAVLGVRPRNPATDIGVGLTAGGVAGIVALSCGTGWALILGTALSSQLGSSESRTLLEIGLRDAEGRPDEPLRVFTDEYGRRSEAEPPGWQLQKYPELRRVALSDQSALLHRKLRAELIVGVQIGIWYSLLAVAGYLLLGAAEAAVAGSLLRRHGRAWAMLPGYAERVGPGVAAVYAAIVLTVNLLSQRDSFRPATWGTVLGLAVAALIAAIYRWPWWGRVVLQAAWLLSLAAVVSGVWLPHAP
jgi:hypothetical protein